MQRQTVLLNNEALSRLINEREVKQWLLARRLGIDRKTVSRWISGRTQRISRENLTRLCDILEIGESQICVMDRLEALGTREDRWEAARKLSEQDLVEIIGPTSNWELAESLLKSTIDPDMPAGLLSKLYLLLARVYHYMRRGEDFQRSSEICMRHAQQVSDEFMFLQGRLCLASARLLQTDNRGAAAEYGECLKTPELLTGKAIAASLSNMSIAFHRIGEFNDALEYSGRALEAWQNLKPNMSHATAWHLRSVIHVELGMAEEAAESIRNCQAMCAEVRYQRLANLNLFVEADLLSLQERHEAAVTKAQQGLDLLPDTPQVTAITLEYAARAFRRSGDLDRAQEVLDLPLEDNPHPGYDLASSTMERARLAMARGKKKLAWQYAEEANSLFLDFDATARCVSELPGEYYRNS
ncbi:helix-turn-helix domain-containing protein [bacterium]|nr:helix-turn-helix domain-containing protein [bacterium]